MAIQSLYMSQDNLHFKPINVRIFNGLAYLSTSLEKSVTQDTFCGRCVEVLSTSVLVAGTMMTIPIAIIEFLALGSIGGLALTFYGITGWGCEFWQKYTLKALSYSVHSFFAAIVYGMILFQLPDLKLKSYTINTLADHVLYLLSAAGVQLTFGHYVDYLAERNPEGEDVIYPSLIRAANLLVDDFPALVQDVPNAFTQDLDEGWDTWRARLNGIIDTQILDRHPEFRDLFEHFSFQDLTNEETRNRWLRAVRVILEEANVIHPAEAGEELVFNLNDHDAKEASYQNALKQIIKDALKDIYQKPELLCCFSPRNEAEHGKEMLDLVDSDATIPIAKYAQLKELEVEIVCPAVFHSAKFFIYNTRYQKLTEARAKLLELNAQEKQYLVQKLLKETDFDLNRQGLEGDIVTKIQQCAHEITALAGPLHTGTLMSQPAIDLARGEMAYQNLFAKAWQEVIAENG